MKKTVHSLINAAEIQLINSLPTKEMKIMYMIANFYSVNLIAQLVHVSKTTISSVKKRYQLGIFSKKDKTIGKQEISKNEIEQLRYV